MPKMEVGKALVRRRGIKRIGVKIVTVRVECWCIRRRPANGNVLHQVIPALNAVGQVVKVAIHLGIKQRRAFN